VRNRPSLFPFGTATGRNAHAKSPYNAHAGVRGFIQFAPDTVGAYLDWRTQEVGVAAVRSGDEALIADYRSGDVYHALARLCVLTDDPDPKRWKANNPDQRQRMKPLQLAINYGMGVPSLAKGLNRHPLIASNIIELNRRKYPRFWQWREDTVMTAMLERRIERLAAVYHHQRLPCPLIPYGHLGIAELGPQRGKLVSVLEFEKARRLAAEPSLSILAERFTAFCDSSFNWHVVSYSMAMPVDACCQV